MDRAVEINSEHLKQYKSDFENLILRNEKRISDLLKDIEKDYSEKLSEFKNEYKYQIQKMSKSVGLFNEESNSLKNSLNNSSQIMSSLKMEFEKHNANLNKNCEQLIENNKKNDELCKNINNIVSEQKVCQAVSFSDILKNNKNDANKHVPVMNKNIPLIVIPKNKKQNSDKTKSDLNKKCNPIELNIKNVESRNNGKIVIETDSKENREKIKNELEKKIKGDYEIKIPLELKPCFEIVHMNNEFDESEILEKLRKQNQFLEFSQMKVIRIRKVVKFNKELRNATVQVDKVSFPKIIAAEKLSIGWEKCKVFDAIYVKRCMKCKGYNHKSTECIHKEACFNCHQEHKTSECKEKEEMKKCINCLKANEKFNLGLKTDHKTTSIECPVYQKKLKEKKEKIGY